MNAMTPRELRRANSVRQSLQAEELLGISCAIVLGIAGFVLVLHCFGALWN